MESSSKEICSSLPQVPKAGWRQLLPLAAKHNWCQGAMLALTFSFCSVRGCLLRTYRKKV